MSRYRIVAKLRTNDDYKAVTAWLENACLAYRAVGAIGKGHPTLRITLPCGKEVSHAITCTPSGGGNKRGAIAHLRRSLRKHGLEC